MNTPVIDGVQLAGPRDGSTNYSPDEIRALGKRFDSRAIVAAFKLTPFGPRHRRIYQLLKKISIAVSVSLPAREILTYLIGSDAIKLNFPRADVH